MSRDEIIVGLEQAIAFFRDRVTGDMYDKWLHASVGALVLLKAQEAAALIAAQKGEETRDDQED